MRTSNPVLTRLTEAARNTGLVRGGDGVMTRAGTAGKAAVLLALVVFAASFTWNEVAKGNYGIIGPAMLVGGIGGFVVALITVFKPTAAPITAPIYAVLEGLLVGAISARINFAYPGIAMQAVGLTFATAAGVFVLYRLNVLRATEGFRRIIVAATMGIALFYLVAMLFSLFGSGFSFLAGSSPLAIGINVVVAAVAALNLVLDFDLIDEGARAGAPKKLEWFAAFGLLVTLIWLYLELLRLLARLQGRRD